MKSAIKLKGWTILEQGSGKFDLDGFYDQLMNLGSLPMVQVYPYNLDLTKDATYFLPFSRQRVYSSM